jgi:KDO2-lipid IV(A) lauroyltransferase
MVNFFIYRAGQRLALSVPLKIGYFLAVIFCWLHYIFAFEDRAVVTDNLRAIFPDKSDTELAKIRFGVFKNFAKYLVDFFRFEKIDADYIRRYVRVKNIGYFDQALSKGKGAIVLTAHLGNWELGGAVFSVSAYPLWAVALPHKDERVNDFFDRQRQSKNLHVIPLGQAVRACLRALKENKVIALVGDRDFTKNGVTIDFFGRPTIFPEGPAAFSLQAGAPIIPGFMLRNPDDTFTLVFEKPVEFTASGDKDKDIVNLITRYKAIYEDYIRKYPDQWFTFRRFWKQ